MSEKRAVDVRGDRPEVRPGTARLRSLPRLAVMALLAVAGGQHGVMAGSFTEQSIQGAWGFSASGTVVPPAFSEPTPAVAMGVMTFDGAGGCSILDTFSVGGVSLSRTSTACSYAVDPDGTGTILAFFAGELDPLPLSFVIVDNKKEIRFIRTDLGVASGVAKRQ